MLPNKFFISDPHFFHKNIIRLCGRKPLNRTSLFIDEEEMNEYICQKWNLTVKPYDSVWLLGDVALCKNASDLKSVLRRLNGRIHVITGNHDHHSKLIRSRLDMCNLSSVTDGVVLWENRFLLSHVPVSNPRYVNLHGHLHEKPNPSPMHINMCMEWWDYTPVSIEIIERIIKDRGL